MEKQSHLYRKVTEELEFSNLSPQPPPPRLLCKWHHQKYNEARINAKFSQNNELKQ